LFGSFVLEKKEKKKRERRSWAGPKEWVKRDGFCIFEIEPNKFNLNLNSENSNSN